MRHRPVDATPTDVADVDQPVVTKPQKRSSSQPVGDPILAAAVLVAFVGTQGYLASNKVEMLAAVVSLAVRGRSGTPRRS